MRLGPIARCTLIVHDLDRAIAAYAGVLGQQQRGLDRVPKQRALDMGEPALIDARRALLGSPADSGAWLELIEAPGAQPTQPYARRGWLGLVLNVEEIDALIATLDPGLFRPLGTAADSDAAIPARAVVGPEGEVLYLSTGDRARGQFAIPNARCAIDGPVAAVLGAENCATSIAFYAGLGLVQSWQVEARLAAINQCHNLDPAQQHQAAIGRLHAGQCIEIDSLPFLPQGDATLRCGLRMLGFHRSNADGRRLQGRDDPSARILAGPEGEAVELV